MAGRHGSGGSVGWRRSRVASDQVAVGKVEPVGSVAGANKDRMHDPASGRRRCVGSSAWSGTSMTGCLAQQIARRSGGWRVSSARSVPRRPDERHRYAEVDRVDCVRIVHWMRNALSYVPKGQQSMASAALRQAFIQPDRPTRQPDAAPRRRPAAGQVAEARRVHRRERGRRAGAHGLPRPAPQQDPLAQTRWNA